LGEEPVPLQDYISGNQDDQREEVAKFLYDRWSKVLDEEPVFSLSSESDSAAWTGERFKIEEVKVGADIRARFSFVAKGLDEKSGLTGEEISGSAVAVIDDFDNVEFVEVEAES
jgi:hypothetical protein